jgi:hypothetical protein
VAQLVGSFVTNASDLLTLKVVSKAPGVAGKSPDSVLPVTYALPPRTVMFLPILKFVPLRKVE